MDPQSADWGADVAAKLVAECCGGEASEIVSAGALPNWQRSVSFRPARLATLGGLAVPPAEARRILGTLGFETKGDGDTWTVSIPSWRPDAEGEADLVEEILRIHGYDKIPPVSMTAGGLPHQTVTPQQRRVRLARRALAARGLKLGLISNSHRCLMSFQRHFELEGLIAAAISSAEHGYMKPHPSIFGTALNLAGVTAGESVMVGDSMTHDIIGAQRVGMRGVLVHRSGGQAAAPEDVPAWCRMTGHRLVWTEERTFFIKRREA